MKINKFYFLLLFILLSIIFSKEVKAFNEEDYMVIKENLTEVYITKVADIGLKWHTPINIFVRKSDNKPVYGIEPGLDIKENINYIASPNVESQSYLNNQDWEKIKLIAYYGYNFKNNKIDHTDSKWYAVTQILIWRITRPNWDIFFTDVLYNGNRLDDKFIDEINELNSLVENHFISPYFNADSYQCLKNEKLIIIDNNNVINNYKLKYSDDITIIMNDNQLIIDCNAFGNYELELYQNYNYHLNESNIYTNDVGQNTMVVGDLESYTNKININIHAGNITLQKINNQIEEMKSSIFYIYDENDNFINEITTDKSGYGISDNLPYYGKYYLQEQLDNITNNEKHYFVINKNSVNQNIVIYPHTDTVKVDTVTEKKVVNINEYENIKVNIPKTSLNTTKKLVINQTQYILPETKSYEKKKK